MHKIKSSEITSEKDYLSRREFLKGAGIVSASALILAACGAQAATQTEAPTSIAPTNTVPGSTPTAIEEPLTSIEAVTNFNNYYEFTIDKGRVAQLAKDFPTSPWEVKVGV